MSWAGYERALPPEMIPHRLFDRLFGAARRGLGQPQAEHPRRRPRRTPIALKKKLPDGRSGARGRAPLRHPRPGARHRRPAARVPPRRSAGFRRRHEGLAAHRQAAERSAGAGAGDAADARRVLHADQVPGPVAVPVARATPSARHHDYTHADGKAPGADGVEGQRILRDICRWHVEEFAYLRGEAEVDSGRRRHAARPHAAWCTCTSTPRPIRTRTAAWR